MQAKRSLRYKNNNFTNQPRRGETKKNLHQDVPLSYLVRDIKADSSKFIKNTLLNRQFISWSEKYFGVSCSLDDRDRK